MKKILLILSLLTYTLSFSQSSRFRVSNNTKFGWAQKTVPVKSYSDSTWNSIWFKEDDGDPSDFWNTSGNAISTNTAFIGTTTNRSFYLKGNNNLSMKVDSFGGATFFAEQSGNVFPVTVKGGAAANAVIVLTGPNNSSILYTNSGTGVTWRQNNQTVVGTTLDYFTMGQGGNPSVHYFGLTPTTGYGIFKNRIYIGSGASLGGVVPNALLNFGAGTSALPAIAFTAQTAVASPTNGNVWYEAISGFKFQGAISTNSNVTSTTAGGFISLKEGVNGRMGQVALINGTIDISIANVTALSRAFVQLVIPSGVALTIQYQAVCTAGHLIIQANVQAGTINAADNSTLNYIIYEPN